jgi:hypothetical protein
MGRCVVRQFEKFADANNSQTRATGIAVATRVVSGRRNENTTALKAHATRWREDSHRPC